MRTEMITLAETASAQASSTGIRARVSSISAFAVACAVVGAAAAGGGCEGQVVGGPPGSNHGEVTCSSASDCDDGDGCTVDVCDPTHRCVHEAADGDQDGHRAQCGGGDDCDDARADVFPGAAEQCGDGLDNDCDGLVDCDDVDCAALDECRCESPEVCNDGLDNDCDGRLDCDDGDCDGDPLCWAPSGEHCTDGVDNDLDGLQDCDDSDCALDPACCVSQQEVCDDWIDNDCDLFVDCLDPDCANDPACVCRFEVCGDGQDNDCDGLVDCADDDCGGAVACGGAACADSSTRYCSTQLFASIDIGQPIVGHYSCGPSNESGWERTFLFTSGGVGGNEPMMVMAEVRYDDGLNLYVLDAGDVAANAVCDPGRCIAYDLWDSSGGTQVTFIAEPERSYYLVVESPVAIFGTIALDIDCQAFCAPEVCGDGFDNDCDGWADCLDPDCAGDPACSSSPPPRPRSEPGRGRR